MAIRRVATRLAVILLVVAPDISLGQTATVSGFVTDRSDGNPLEGATVALYRFEDGFEAAPTYGRAADASGAYVLRGIQPGSYLLQISFIGYRAHRDTLALTGDDVHTVTVGLEPDEERLNELLVQAERQYGAARITAGHQRIRPEEIEIIPAPDVSSDLAGYLTTLPGVVTRGDRGGQFFIRGGEPTQNLVIMDGMTVYQPFHVLGFYSAFPAEIIDHVDFFAGGFGAKYGGRLSSVLDMNTRAGNNRRFGGMASASPFSGALRLEGPIVPGHASFLLSARRSFIHRSGPDLYDEVMPFEFGDLFAKVQGRIGPRNRLSATGFETHDRGTLVADIGQEEAQEVRWTNAGGSFRWFMLPRTMPVVAELTISRSRHEMEQGKPSEIVRSTVIRDTRVALDATFSEGSFFGGQTSAAAGWEVVFGRAENELGGLFQNIENSSRGVTSFGLYFEPEFLVRSTFKVSPGIRMQGYSVRLLPYIEPRLRASWDYGKHHISGAVGLYQQHLVGLTHRRDAASVFTAWAGIPRVNDRPPRVRGVREIAPETFALSWPENENLEMIGGELLRGRLGSAYHALLGYRAEPSAWLEISAEGFYKHVRNLYAGELTPFPRLTTRLLPTTGRSIGIEARVEVRRRPWYAFVTYGLSSTVYRADGRAVSLAYGVDGIRYRPGHDRRHQVNALASTSLGGFDVSLRWQFGSGLPYTQPLGFDGFVLIDRISTVFDLEASRRVIYDEPFGDMLPAYHRLDVSVERTLSVKNASLTFQASAINLYDRRNIFYVDLFTLARRDQLPFVPSLGIKIEFE